MASSLQEGQGSHSKSLQRAQEADGKLTGTWRAWAGGLEDYIFLMYLCMLFEFFVFGHISFVWLFANYFWNLYMLYELFVFGHVSCEVVNLFVYLGFGFRFLIWGYYFVIIWIYSLIFLICDNYLIWNMFLIFIWYFCV